MRYYYYFSCYYYVISLIQQYNVSMRSALVTVVYTYSTYYPYYTGTSVRAYSFESCYVRVFFDPESMWPFFCWGRVIGALSLSSQIAHSVTAMRTRGVLIILKNKNKNISSRSSKTDCRNNKKILNARTHACVYTETNNIKLKIKEWKIHVDKRHDINSCILHAINVSSLCYSEYKE